MKAKAENEIEREKMSKWKIRKKMKITFKWQKRRKKHKSRKTL